MTAPIAFTIYTSGQVAELVQPGPREIPRLIEMREAVERLRDDNFEIIPDRACDRLYDASVEIMREIIAAPITCAADIADKFRFAAKLIEEGADGMLIYEPPVVFAALSDLIAARGCEYADLCPDAYNPYGRITISE